MATILRTKAKFYQYSHRDGNDVDHCIESEGDRFIKELSTKQLDTNVSLRHQLETRKEFESSHSYQPVTEHTRGNVSYDEFKKLSACDSENVAQSGGFSDQTTSKNVSRHVRELAVAVKPNSLETKLLEFAIKCNAVGNIKTDDRPDDHPINQLDEIHDRLFGHLNSVNDPQKTAKTILRKRRQLLESISDPVEVKKKPEPTRANSLWDVDDVDSVEEIHRARSKVYSCQKQRLFTIRDGQIVELPKKNSKTNESTSQTVDASQSETSKLSVEEIRKLPKFENYEKGPVSEVLYVKNLSPRVDQIDLVSIFAKYQQEHRPRIIYNLMRKGKMRGQAFVNFHCSLTATRALEEVNGTVLYGKPIIAQFSSSAIDKR